MNKEACARHIFSGMKQRCYNPNNSGYKRYGGRGISICRAWLNDPSKFVKFALDNGYEPGLSIDRINNDGNYEPSNCRFITRERNSGRQGFDSMEEEEEALMQEIFIPHQHTGEIPDIFDVHVPCIGLVDYPTGYDPATGNKRVEKGDPA